MSSTISHGSVNFRRAVSIQKSALLSVLNIDFSSLVWHCGIQPRSSVTSSPRAQSESIIATQPLPESGPSLTPSPTSPVPQPLSQPGASLTPSPLLTLAVPSPTSLVPQPGPSLTPSPTSQEIQTLPQPEPSTTPITTSQSQPVLSFKNIPLLTAPMGDKRAIRAPMSKALTEPGFRNAILEKNRQKNTNWQSRIVER